MFKFQKNSIRNKLFFTISSLILLSLVLIYFLGFFNTKKEIQEVLDANMAKSSKLILALIYHELEEGEQDGFLNDFEENINQKILHEYENKIHIQVWRHGNLIYASSHNFEMQKPKQEGFFDTKIQNEKWRSFVLKDSQTQVAIVILEKYQIRNNLTWKILASPFIPLAISSLVILLIWLFIDKKIVALNLLSRKIAHISAAKLQKVDLDAPFEIKPLLDSINDLIARLSSSIEAERRFTDYAAHELRTPLAVIKTHVQLLIKDKSKINDDEYLEDLENSLERMIYLVNQILILSRLEAENVKIEKEKFLLSEIINSEIKLQHKAINDKKLQVNFAIKNEKPYFANKLYSEIMLRNLIDNAVKYSANAGSIDIDLSFKEEKIIFKISNIGNFIDAIQREKLFDIFYRIENSNSVAGCGLGLAITKKIIKLFAGNIEFFSEKIDNKGAINEVRLTLNVEE